MSALTSLALTAMLAGAGLGQRPSPETGANVVGTELGLDGATLAWSLGYARALFLPRERSLVLATRFALPMTQPDFGDWRWEAGARVDALALGRFAWPVELDLVLRGLSNRSVGALGIGTELITMPGWYPKRWFIAAELSWDQQWGVRLEHSAAYERFVYEGVRDGWYGPTGATMRYGLRVGGLPWRHMELWARGGYEQHGRFDLLAPPLYAIAGVNFRF
ncbi:hypothetical protein G6O69_01820 [Pseudenhygromyxa sp. WMMC2535]|uniref:hypothetical protein n=1 Tax=Pseudenhygromyxa sp. WMMC2535 TaxID=2712867 RepID=UPI001553E67C|nr:hypothetical protein [Pseudenhygromyxa sp. WMMC2535]NVB36552.1 hypothetical protein [Pseudenhygromyxa sp. WMMC2535]